MNPLNGEIPNNSENANTIANIVASPHPHGTQADLIKEQHDSNESCAGCTADPKIPVA